MPAGLLRLRKPSVVIRKFGNGCNGCNGYNGYNGYNGCQEEGRRKQEKGREKVLRVLSFAS
jgi:hypothetical protein